MTIAFVTDSTADIPAELTDKYAIHVVPNIMVLDGETLKDGEDITRQEFYRRLPDLREPPTTGTASTGAYQTLYARLLERGFEHVCSIHAAARLSGIFSAASVAADQFGGRVQVLDSQQLSMGLGLQVLAAARAAQQGASPAEIARLIADMHPRVHVIAMLDTLEYIRRSGRVSWARARLGNLLRIKPFIELRFGEVNSLGETRTRRKGLERLRSLLENLGPLEALAVLHSNAEADAHTFLNSLNLSLPDPPPVVNVTPIIGVHVGPNGLGFAAVTRSGG